MTRKANDANFCTVVEKYTIARDATKFDKDAHARRYFEDARPALRRHCFTFVDVRARVGHHVLLRSERIILLPYFKACNVLLHSFFESLTTYETQKNDAFFCFLFLRT